MLVSRTWHLHLLLQGLRQCSEELVMTICPGWRQSCTQPVCAGLFPFSHITYSEGPQTFSTFSNQVSLIIGSAWNWVPIEGFQMMLISLIRLSVCDTTVSAAHLHPDLVVTPLPLTVKLVNSLYITTARHFGFLNSLTTDNGSGCN